MQGGILNKVSKTLRDGGRKHVEGTSSSRLKKVIQALKLETESYKLQSSVGSSLDKLEGNLFPIAIGQEANNKNSDIVKVIRLVQTLPDLKPKVPDAHFTQDAHFTLVKFNPSGKYLARTHDDFSISVWELLSEEGQSRAGSSLKSETSQLNDQANSSYTSQTNSSYCISPFSLESYRIWRSHEAPIRHITWSAHDFMASVSQDNIIKIWHLSRNECLVSFVHRKSLAELAFHPEDRYLLVASEDQKISIWSLEEKKIIAWNRIITAGLLTTLSFTPDASMCVVGTTKGEILFYEFPSLEYNTQIDLRRGLSVRAAIIGIEPIKSHWDDEDRLLITSSDSSITIYNVKDRSLHVTCNGITVPDPTGKAVMFTDKVVMAPSGDKYVYFWNLDSHFKKCFPLKKGTGVLGWINSGIQHKTDVVEELNEWVRFRLERQVKGSVSLAAKLAQTEYTCSLVNDGTNTSKNKVVLVVGAQNLVYVYLID